MLSAAAYFSGLWPSVKRFYRANVIRACPMKKDRCDIKHFLVDFFRTQPWQSLMAWMLNTEKNFLIYLSPWTYHFNQLRAVKPSAWWICGAPGRQMVMCFTLRLHIPKQLYATSNTPWFQKHNTPNSWQISFTGVDVLPGKLEWYENPFPPMESMLSCVYVLAKQVYATCRPCTGLATVDGRCGIMTAASNTTANIWRCDFWHRAELFWVMNLKFRRNNWRSVTQSRHRRNSTAEKTSCGATHLWGVSKKSHVGLLWWAKQDVNT